MTDLGSTLKIGCKTVRNRLGMAPMGTMFAEQDGSPSDQMICYYSARARGGVGIVVVEVTHVTQKYGSGIARVSCFHSDYQIEKFKQLANAVKAHGALVILQLSIGFGAHGFLDENLQPRYGELYSSSAYEVNIPEGSMPRILKANEGSVFPSPRALETWEVKAFEQQVVRAAERARKAGFDGIEIHAAHGLALASFMSPRFNFRTDEYGGSREGRLKLVRSLIRSANDRVRDDNFLIGLRISGDEHCFGGLSLEDNKKIVPVLVEEGLDYVSVSSGRNVESYNWTFPENEGVQIEEISEIKKVTHVPVLCANIHNPATAKRVISEELADIVLLGRSLLADPDWANKTLEDRNSEISRCVFCYTCLGLILQDQSLRCVQNPNLGRERFVPEYWPLPVRQERLITL